MCHAAPHWRATHEVQVCQRVRRCVGDFRAECGGSCLTGRGGVSVFRDVCVYFCVYHVFSNLLPVTVLPLSRAVAVFICFVDLLRVCSPSGADGRGLGRARRGAAVCVANSSRSQQSAPHGRAADDAEVRPRVERCVGNVGCDFGWSCVAGRGVGACRRFLSVQSISQFSLF